MSAILILTLLLTISGCSGNPVGGDEQMPTADYRTIMGITTDEITAIDNIISAKTSFKCAVMKGTSYFHSDGRYKGFSALVCEWLSDLFGIKFEPVETEWDDLLAGVQDGTYDFSLEIPTTLENKNAYFTTDAFAQYGMRLFIAPGRSLINMPSPIKYGYLEGRELENQLAVHINSGHTLISVKNLTEAQDKLNSGDIDAFIGKETAEAAITDYSSIEVFAGLSSGNVSLSTRKPGLSSSTDFSSIISAVQKCLATSDGNYISELKKTGHYQYLGHKLNEQLEHKPLEKAYISAHNTEDTAITIGIDYDNYPCSFYNEQENEWQGIAIDILNEISAITEIKFKPYDSGDAEWAILLAALKKGDIAMTSSFIRTEDRLGKFLWTETPYVTDNYALLSMTEYPNINVNQVYQARVGIVPETAYALTFLEMYPGHPRTTEYKNNLAAFNALERGEVDVLMMAENHLLNATNYLEKTGYKINLMFDWPYESYYGFNVNEEILCSVISNAQKLVDIQRINDTWSGKVFDYRSKLALAGIPYLIAGSAILLGALALLTVLFLKNRSMRKRLAVKVEATTHELAERTIISYTDKLTNIYNRFMLDEELIRCCERNVGFCVLIIDIDHFKRVNDTYGHLVGDQVLVELTKCISGIIRTNDTFARWGGEEFVILQPYGDIDAATEFAERLRKQISEHNFETVGSITVSIGVTDHLCIDTPATLMRRADRALYKSKENGRNRVTTI